MRASGMPKLSRALGSRSTRLSGLGKLSPMAPVCSFDQYRSDDLTQTSYEPASHVYDRLIPSSCLGRSGHSAGIDFDLNTDDAVYAIQGTVVGSMVGRGIDERILRDGVDLRAGDLGAGAYLHAGKLGGTGKVRSLEVGEGVELSSAAADGS